MSKQSNPILNVLADRYASIEMAKIWARETKIRLERQLWIAVMRAEGKHGVGIRESDISQYEKFVDVIDLRSIDDREKTLRHDVKARIEEFNSLAGLQLIHLGMTSRDLTENVELLQIRSALVLIQRETVSILNLLAHKMTRYSNLVMVGRSHNVPAQLTTLGKRFATVAEELLFAYERLSSLIERLPFKGLRGPVGTAQDIVSLVGSEAAIEIENEIAKEFGFSRVLDSTGQVYPRSIDFEVISTLVQLSAAPSSFATTMRLMSGAGLVSEGFKEGQVGSSAMPHKINARSSERINGLAIVLKGYLSMISEVAGDQWNEGDVSCSVVRRVALQDAFLALNGIFQTQATILNEMKVFEDQIHAEVERELPFVSSTELLMAAVKRGLGREDAHKIIQKHSLASIENLRSGLGHTFIEDLGNDQIFPLSQDEIEKLLSNQAAVLSAARRQVNEVLRKISGVHPQTQVQFETIR